MQEFVKDLLSNFVLAPIHTTVTVIAFDSSSRTLCPLSGDPTTVGLAIDTEQSTGATDVSGAIKLGQQELDLGLRTTARKIMLLMTDGDDTIAGQNQVVIEANAAKAKGTRLMAIGIGSALSDQNLRDIVSTTDGALDYYPASDFDKLKSLIQGLTDGVCITITEITPGAVCIGEARVVTIKGKGFGQKAHSGLRCKFGNVSHPGLSVMRGASRCGVAWLCDAMRCELESHET